MKLINSGPNKVIGWVYLTTKQLDNTYVKYNLSQKCKEIILTHIYTTSLNTRLVVQHAKPLIIMSPITVLQMI